jgi:hypothetical protein
MFVLGWDILQQGFFDKELYHSPSEHLGELCGIFNRHVMERARIVDSFFQNDTVIVWIPSHKGVARKSCQKKIELHYSFDRLAAQELAYVYQILVVEKMAAKVKGDPDLALIGRTASENKSVVNINSIYIIFYRKIINHTDNGFWIIINHHCSCGINNKILFGSLVFLYYKFRSCFYCLL